MASARGIQACIVWRSDGAAFSFATATSAERMRWKRARDRGMVCGEGDESQLSDTALIGQLAIAC